MNTTLTTILEKQRVLTPEGQEVTLHSAVDGKEVAFITKMIQDFKCKHPLEVGCAMGISALAICEAIVKNDSASIHTIIDPYQSTDWKNIGICQLQRAGYKNYRLIEKPSEFALPQLVQENCSFDFAFIDGWHTFDHTLIDFFYINRLLEPGGILLVDDVQMPAVKKVMRMISTYPCYRFIDCVKVSETKKAKALGVVKKGLQPLAKLFGKRIANELFDASVVNGKNQQGLNSSVIAFQKIAKDNRSWNWFESF